MEARRPCPTFGVMRSEEAKAAAKEGTFVDAMHVLLIAKMRSVIAP